jgi:hypothetical protein
VRVRKVYEESIGESRVSGNSVGEGRLREQKAMCRTRRMKSERWVGVGIGCP